MVQEQQFSVEVINDYVRLKTWGGLDINNLDAPVNAALALAVEKHIEKLLDDIRDIDSSGVSMSIQTKSMGILWKLRTFKKVAIIIKGSRVKSLFFAALDVLNLDRVSKFKGFEDETEAIEWLEAP